MFFFQLMKLGQKMLGKKLFGEIMKRTFYGQFVAGPVFSYSKITCQNRRYTRNDQLQMLNSRTLWASHQQSPGCTASG